MRWSTVAFPHSSHCPRRSVVGQGFVPPGFVLTKIHNTGPESLVLAGFPGEEQSWRVPWAACPPLMSDGCGWHDKGERSAYGSRVGGNRSRQTLA